MKSWFVSTGFCPIFTGHDWLRNRTKILETGIHVLHEQRMYATHGFDAERLAMSSLMLIRGESD